MEDLGLSPEAIELALAGSGRNFDDSDSETDENASTSLLEESQESGVESDSDAASELAIFQVSFFLWRQKSWLLFEASFFDFSYSLYSSVMRVGSDTFGDLISQKGLQN